MEHLRIFLSSPGDVADERGVALTVIDRLQYDPFVRGRATFEVVTWDKPGAGPPILADITPQASIDEGLPRPSECDIVAVILWSRIGTPLPFPDYRRPDGGRYLSGTEWEFEDGLRGARERGRPAVLLYRRTARVLLDPDELGFEDRVRQRRLVEEFFGRLHDPETGTVLSGYKRYETPDELRGELESDLRALVQRRIGGRPAAPVEGPRSPEAGPPLWQGSPFPGLRALTPSDGPIFFGRGRETDQLLARVAGSRFVAVVGSSGSGKSSLVGAGLLPRLGNGALAEVPGWLLPEHDPRTNQWQALRFTPGELGEDPFLAPALRLAPLVGRQAREIASDLAGSPEHVVGYVRWALRDREPGTEALVFVDQLEELFTMVTNAHVEPFGRLLESLCKSASSRVVATLRADFYHRCLELPVLARLLEQGHFPLSAPVDTLFEMIVLPAERAGLRLEEGLAGRIVADTGRQPGALPLLAYTLDELYRARGDTHTLSVAAYEALGGVRGAIGNRAEDVFAHRLDDATRERFSRVFRELVEVDERGQAARRRVPLHTFAADDGARRLLDVFTEARLLVQTSEHEHEPVVFVAHEALFEGWRRLQAWIQLGRDDMRQLRRVTLAAQEWEEHGRDESYLWPHERLEPVYEMLERLQPALDPVTRLFVRPEHERLLPVLTDPETGVYRRQVTADRLVAIGEATLPGLLAALQSPAPAVRTAAVSGLARLGSSAVPGLLEVVRGSPAEVRISAIAALRLIADERAAPGLVEALRDADRRVRSVAAGALEAFGGPDAAVALAEVLQDSDVDVRWRAAGALGAFGEAAVGPLLRSLQDGDPKVRAAARDAFVAIGETGVDRLLGALHDAEAGTRAAAAEALVGVGAPAVRGLAQALADDDPDVRWRAAEALASIGDRAALPGLLEAAADPEPLVRRSALEALRLVPDETAVPALTRALADPEEEVAEMAAAALAAAGPLGVDGLVAMLREPGADVAAARAASALARVGPAAIPGLLALLRDGEAAARQRAAGALVACGGLSVPGLLSDLRRAGDEDAELAIAVLGEIGEVAVPGLVELLADRAPAVRRAATTALAAIGPGGTAARRVVPALVDLLGDDDHATRAAAADGLGAVGEAALPALFRALQGPEPSVREAAARALAAAGGLATPGLLELVHRSEGAARDLAAAALREIGTPAALFGLAERGLAALAAQSQK